MLNFECEDKVGIVYQLASAKVSKACLFCAPLTALSSLDFQLNAFFGVMLGMWKLWFNSYSYKHSGISIS